MAVTPALALRLGTLSGDGPDVWLRMQSALGLAAARAEMVDEFAEIPALPSAAS